MVGQVGEWALWAWMGLKVLDVYGGSQISRIWSMVVKSSLNFLAS